MSDTKRKLEGEIKQSSDKRKKVEEYSVEKSSDITKIIWFSEHYNGNSIGASEPWNIKTYKDKNSNFEHDKYTVLDDEDFENSAFNKITPKYIEKHYSIADIHVEEDYGDRINAKSADYEAFSSASVMFSDDFADVTINKKELSHNLLTVGDAIQVSNDGNNFWYIIIKIIIEIDVKSTYRDIHLKRIN